MKIALLTLLVSISTYTSRAQSLKVSPVTEKNTIALLSSIERYETFQGGNLYVQIFMQANPPGSANIPEGHEISHNLLLVVGAYDLYFDGKLFKVGAFYNPLIRKKSEVNGKIIVLVEHGFAAERKETKITIELNKVTIQ